ncbi:MAG: adenylosuccinate lyase [SAR202 cluster bacterium]|nr:adenylosuccinate lyase [SAR202 cluster bacterium]
MILRTSKEIVLIPRYSREKISYIWSDENMYNTWLKVEIATCEAWNELGIIPDKDLEKIKLIQFDMKKYDKYFEETKHDIVSFVKSISENLGEESRWIHHGITSNDVKDTALSLQLIESIDHIDAEINKLMESIKIKAINEISTPIMGRSHGMHAEPMSFGAKLGIFWDELSRHSERFNQSKKRASICMISGPVGSYATVSPKLEKIISKKLGLNPGIITNQIIQRDIHAEYCQNLALLASTLEKLAIEIRHLQRSEVDEAREPFGKEGFVTKGSSSMPHKRNPELSERICGLARVIRSNSSTALQNVPLWHERDISHSSAERVILPDSSIASDYILFLANQIISGLEIKRDNMLRNLDNSNGLIFSPRIMLKLVESGIDKNEAYDLVQTMSMEVLENKKNLKDLCIQNKVISSLISEKEISEIFDYDFYLRFTKEQFRSLGWKIN